MTIPLFKKPVALDRDAHRNTRIKLASPNFSYAALTNSVPLTVSEFSLASVEYPIVFMLDDKDAGTPITLLGVRDNENLLVNEKGEWDAAYIPAFVRHYPFALHQSPDSDKAIVVMDEEFDNVTNEEGIRLFNDDGSPSPQLEQTVNVLQDFHQQQQSSIQFVALLKKHDLLVGRMLELTSQNNEKIQLDGFALVDESRIPKLDDKALLELARSGALGLIYAHLISLGTLQRLVDRVASRLSAPQTA